MTSNEHLPEHVGFVGEGRHRLLDLNGNEEVVTTEDFLARVAAGAVTVPPLFGRQARATVNGHPAPSAPGPRE